MSLSSPSERQTRPALRRWSSLALVVLLFGLLAPCVPAVRQTLDEAGVPGFGSDSPLPATPETPPYALPAELAGSPEIVALRTENTATFKQPDGTFALLKDSNPLHYRDEKGQWQPIRPTFDALDNGWRNTANLIHTSVARQQSAAMVGTATASAPPVTSRTIQVADHPPPAAFDGEQSRTTTSKSPPASLRIAAHIATIGREIPRPSNHASRQPRTRPPAASRPRSRSVS